MRALGQKCVLNARYAPYTGVSIRFNSFISVLFVTKFVHFNLIKFMEKDLNIQEEELFNMQDIVNDPYAMFNEHIWLTLPVVPRDTSVWTKTPKEKAILKRLRKFRYNLGNWGGPARKSPTKNRLTIHLASAKPYPVKTRKGVKVVCQTTVSTVCYPEDVNGIIESYRKNNDVKKFHYNGKTYKL